MEPSTVMQCAACRAVYDSPIADCPTCQTPLATADANAPAPAEEIFMNTSTCHETTNAALTDEPLAPAQTSTLIEFPVAGRANRPQWRKDLSERVREIQQRRAQEAAREAEEAARIYGVAATAQIEDDANAPQLGLVPPPPEPAEVNPILVKALERIERARQQPPPQTNAMRQPARDGVASTAAARAREESQRVATQTRAASTEAQTHAAAEPQIATEQEASADDGIAKTVESARTTNLVIVPPTPSPASETDALIMDALSKPRPRRHLSDVADDALLARREAKILPSVADPSEGTRRVATPARRFAGGLIDLLVVAFAASPFAAIIELTNGNWFDVRVAGSLAGIVVVIMFVYLTASVALGGRTWGMALVSARVTDERSDLIPTAGQCARRAFFFMLSLAALGIPLLAALFGSERRALHDRLSHTLVVRAD